MFFLSSASKSFYLVWIYHWYLVISLVSWSIPHPWYTVEKMNSKGNIPNLIPNNMFSYTEIIYLSVLSCIFLVLLYELNKNHYYVFFTDLFCLVSICLIAFFLLTVDFINQYMYIEEEEFETCWYWKNINIDLKKRK